MWLLAACGIALLALALRLQGLGEHPLWGDEAHTARRAESLKDVVIERKLQPLYAVTRLAFLIGKDEWAIRLPHVLYGGAGVLLVAFAGRAFAGPRVGLVAAILLAVSPFHVFHSREARHYSLFVLLTIASMLLVRKAVETRRASWTLAFLGAGILGFHNHAFATIPFAAHAIWGFLEVLRDSRRDGALSHRVGLRVAAFAALLAIAAAALYFLNPRLWRAAGSWMGGDQERRFDVGIDTFRLVLAWLGGGAGLAAWVHALLFAAGFISLTVRRPPAARLIGVTAMTTAAALLLVEWIGPTHPFRVRYTIFLLPAYLLGVSAGVCLAADLLRLAAERLLPGRASEPRKRWTTALAHAVPVAALIAVTLPALRWSLEYRSADYRMAVEHLARRMAPEDVLALPPYRAERHFAGLRWYLSRKLPAREKSVLVRTPGDVDALLEAGKRVWLVDLLPSDLDPAEADPGLAARLVERFEEAARTPPGLYSPDLGPPDPREEIRIRVSRDR